jgi:hypothetical protein
MLLFSLTLCQIYLFEFIRVEGDVNFKKHCKGEARAIQVWEPLLYELFALKLRMQ